MRSISLSSRPYLRWLLMMLGLLVATVGIETWQVVRRADTLRRERERLRELQGQVGLAGRRLRDTAQQRDAAAGELRQLTPVENDAERELSQDVQAWLGRVRQLQAIFQARPGQAIPEMTFLGDDTWLRVARDAQFGDDDQVRRAMAAVRAAAKGAFAERLRAALTKYVAAQGVVPPASTLALTPYFSPTVDPSILARYEVMSPESGSTGGNPFSIRERTAIDEHYDVRYTVMSNGGGSSGPGMEMWRDDVADALRRAQQAFGTDPNNKRSRARGLQDLLPYLQPLLDAQTLENLVKEERNRQDP